MPMITTSQEEPTMVTPIGQDKQMDGPFIIQPEQPTNGVYQILWVELVT